MGDKLLENALKLASQGFYVIPIRVGSKVPAILKWQKFGTNEAAKVEEMFRFAGAHAGGIGGVMGKAVGMVGLDIDYDDGADPSFLRELPVSWTVKSGKGHHVYFRYPEKWPDFGLVKVIAGNKVDERGNKKPCVSLRGNNHYFVLPPSIHPETKRAYEFAKYEGWDDRIHADFLSPDEIPLADPPEWLLEAVLNQLEKTNAISNGSNHRLPGQKYYENERHAMFVATATKMRREGHEYQSIVDRLKYRNQNDCQPPKPDADREIANIATWVMKSVAVEPEEASQAFGSQAKKTTSQPEQSPPQEVDLQSLQEAILTLGHLDNDYFYITKSNRQITRISGGGHGPGALLNLMPIEFWAELFPGKRSEVNWNAAASYLMKKCRERGPFDAKRVRGAGCWRDGNELVVHLGNILLVRSGSETARRDLFELRSRYSYRLGPDYPPPLEAATTSECLSLVRACEAPLWQRSSSGKLFAGHLALLRISGALPWRPHGWITGPAGCGKTTLMRSLVATMGGKWALIPQSDTTASGIRQALEVDSRPVLFDEIEGEHRQAANRIRAVLELARQSSSDGEGRILKGTPDGRGLEYKINSMFMVASIGVALTQEADITRFCLYELKRTPKGANALEHERKLEAVSEELADKIFGRYVKLYDVLLANYQILRQAIANRSSQRYGQQYGMLLAGYVMLLRDDVISEAEANCLADEIELAERTGIEVTASSEETCLERLLISRIRPQIDAKALGREFTIRELIERAQGDMEVAKAIQNFGLKVSNGQLSIASENPDIERIYADTPWQASWKQMLLRIPGAKASQVRFNGASRRCVSIPLQCVLGVTADTLSDNELR